MLRLEALQLYNWGYAPYHQPLPVGDITLLRGNNGSGKTTYLTGIALLLGLRQPHRQNFDRFLYPGADWGFIRGLACNRPDAKGQRPFDQILPATYEDQVTLACVLERNGGRWQRDYYIVPGDFIPDPERKVDKQFQFNYTQYCSMLAQVGVRDALLRLLELGLVGVRGISNDPAARFQAFLKLVGDETIQQRYAEAKDKWQVQRDQTLHKVDELRDAESKREELEEQARFARKRREFKTQLARAELFLPHAQMRELQGQLQEERAKTQAARAEITRVERSIATNQLHQDAYQKRRDAWETEYTAWKVDRDAAERQFRTIEAQVARVTEQVRQQQAEITIFESLPDIPLETAERLLAQANMAFTEAAAQLQRLKEERARLENERASLLEHQRSLPTYVTEFLAALKQEGIIPFLVADAVEVLDQTWRAAVEGCLGDERFTVVVESDQQLILAKQCGERWRYRHYISSPNRQCRGVQAPDSLWEVVAVTDERVAGWVFERLAAISRVDDVKTGHRLAQQRISSITQQAYLQMPRGGRSVWPRESVCGREAYQLRLAEVNAQLERLQGALAQANAIHQQTNQQYQEHIRALDAVKKRLELPALIAAMTELEQQLTDRRAQLLEAERYYQRLKALEDEFMRRNKALAAEETRLISDRRGLEQALASAQQQQNEAESNIGRLENRKRSLGSDLLPLDDAMRAIFDREVLSAEQYQTQLREAREALEQLPLPGYQDADEVIEQLYKRQQQRVEYLRDEVDQMRARESQHRSLFEEAQRDFREYVHHLFDRQMHQSFRTLCAQVDAQGEIKLHDDAQDNWHMSVRVGFHHKPMQALENAPLSQGEQVITGLFLVLAALQAVRATPILLLDELMSTLDEINAPIVLEGLRRTGAQCFIATPHIRPQADAIADVLWALQPLNEGQSYAPTVGVLVRNQESSPG